MNKEIWKNILDHEGYQVSNLGRVKSLPRKSSASRNLNGMLLKIDLGSDRYARVKLSKNSKKKTYLVHRIVLLSFCPNPNPIERPFVNHKDGNTFNNNLENLEWCSHAENMNHAYSFGLFKTKRPKQKQST